jgi:hypothetical protein
MPPLQIWFVLGLNPIVVPTLNRGTHRFGMESLALLISVVPMTVCRR